jgi:hypothetical protein
MDDLDHEDKIRIRATTTRLPVDLHDWLRRYVADRFPLTQNDVIVMALRRYRDDQAAVMVDDVALVAEREEGGAT